MHLIEKRMKFIPDTITKEQAKDTGMAMVLICLIVALFAGKEIFYVLAIVLHLVNMIVPHIFKPVAKIWLGFSLLIGAVMSRVILSFIFLMVVLPVGFFRRMIGKDPLRLNEWKRNRTSVFKTREHGFTSEDIQHPY